MQSNYKRLGDYIREVNIRNKGLKDYPLLGVSIQKKLMPSIANTIGTDMSTYKLIKRNQFAYGPVTSRNGEKISIALADQYENALLSQAYTVFEVIDENELHPEYLMMWFKRAEFDRYARFMSHGSAREIFSWAEMCEVLLPIPSPEKQLEIVREYNVVQNRIKLNNQFIAKLEETAQAIYKQWFVDFEFPNENGLPYKSSGGEMNWQQKLNKELPIEWTSTILNDLVNNQNPITYGVVKPGDIVLNGVKFIRSGDLKSGQILFPQLRTISLEISGQYKRTKLSGGEIVISIVGNPGQIALVPSFLAGANIARQVAVVKPHNSKVALYLKNYLISIQGQETLRDITIGSVQEVINLEDLRNIIISIPKQDVLNKYDILASSFERHLQLNYRINEELMLLKELVLSKMTKI